ncbi:unnamed protein product, partial [Didymodactylos carnosus]
EFVSEADGEKHVSSFYDIFPDIKSLAESYSVQRCGTNAADCNDHELAKFIEEQFYILIDTTKDQNDPFVR